MHVALNLFSEIEIYYNEQNIFLLQHDYSHQGHSSIVLQIDQ